ncbi:MAG: signal recognition particle-docking protein FtsY [Traorella sp.]
MGFLTKLKNTFASKNDQDRYLSGLAKSKNSFSNKIRKLSLNFSGVNEEFLEELMVILLEADLGIHTAEKVVNEVENRAIDHHLKTAEEIEDCLVEVLSDIYNQHAEEPFHENHDGPTVIMMVGVNGSGKTTTTAKLAHYFLKQNKSVCLAAADTFRAGAVDQLVMWAERLDIPCIKGKANADPSSVLVDACRYAKEHDIDILICDTAGRLQNKINLMNELSKMRRVVSKEIARAPHETWLVLDSTTGQNGLSQAEIFHDACSLSGVVLTKLDGTSKGGIVIAIKDRLNLGVKFIGLGEQLEDLRPFDLESYLYSISEGFIKDEKD